MTTTDSVITTVLADPTTVVVTTTISTTTTTKYSTCICGSPPNVANGEVRFAGPYLNNSAASYDCDSGYTNAGKDSLLCLADSTCSNPSWTVDTTNTNSGYPDCQAVVPNNDVFNTYNTSGGGGLDGWAMFALLFLMFLLLLLAVILMLWYWLCREGCRRCCMKRCPCCRNCCYEIPYSQPRQQQQVAPQPVYHPEPAKQVMYHSPEPAPQVHQVESAYATSTPPLNRTPRGDVYSPVTPRKVVVVDRRAADEDFYRRHIGIDRNANASNSNAEITGNQPKEFVKMNDEKLALPQLEPREFVALRQDKIYKNMKPVDSHGNPLWMPHNKNMRTGAHHLNTSTK